MSEHVDRRGLSVEMSCGRAQGTVLTFGKMFAARCLIHLAEPALDRGNDGSSAGRSAHINSEGDLDEQWNPLHI